MAPEHRSDVNLQKILKSLFDIDRSTAANGPRPFASFSALKNPQCIPVNRPQVFQGLRPRIWPRLLRLVTKAISERLLDLKLTHEGITADVCGNPLQVQQPYCSERPPGFPEIRIRRPSYLTCESLGMVQSHRDYSAMGDLKGEQCESSASGTPIAP